MPISQSNPLTELNNDSMLRQRRMPGQPTEEEVSGSQAATIMTSVSNSQNLIPNQVKLT